jgi:hypothetical protein
MEGCHHVVGGNNFASWGAVGDVDGKLKFKQQKPAFEQLFTRSKKIDSQALLPPCLND